VEDYFIAIVSKCNRLGINRYILKGVWEIAQKLPVREEPR